MTESVIDIIKDTWQAEAKVSAFARGRISPSKLVQGCKLACYHDLIGTPALTEANDFDRAMTLDVGKFIHGELQGRFVEAYKKLGVKYLPEVPTFITEKCHGTTDAILYWPSEVTVHEYKSCSKSVFEGLGKRPIEYNEDQWQLYARPNNAKRGKIVYICRNDFRIKEYDVEQNEDTYTRLVTDAIEIEMAAKTKTPPAAKESFLGNSPCTKICVYRELCPLANRYNNRTKI